MKLLLDTHIWIWSFLSPASLSTRVADALTSRDNELWLSPITIWEAMLLIKKGRVAVSSAPAQWIELAMRSAPLREAALTIEVAVQSRLVKLRQEDPADRFLVATAKVYDLTFVTSDKQLLKTREIQVLANR
ncbi:MAG: type II toxin-antitoxin system VapC family toxin [Gemmatimonadaceae bacterium]